jgi:hypothetical protein
MKISTATAAAALSLAVVLCGCETATPYQPLQPGSAVSGGFTDQRLDANHFRVTFAGNTLTTRATVETYLLYRAAQLTVAQGYDWFEPVYRHTERTQSTYLDSFYGPGYPWGYWRPSWRYYRGGFGWQAWGPNWGDPFWADTVNVQTVQKFEASAEIAMSHGPKPASDPRALDARAVLDNLGPKIQRPKS